MKVLFLHYHLKGWASQSVEPFTMVSKIRGYLEWQMGAFLQKSKHQFHNASKKNLSTTFNLAWNNNLPHTHGRLQYT